METDLTARKVRKIETGFVGFFDILGYKSFLESGISQITFTVIDILEALRERVKEALMKEHLGDHYYASVQTKLDRIQLRVVSDSVLLWAPYDENQSEADRGELAADFLVTASVLQRDMFEHGLPLRGSIALGEFDFAGNVFAGKPIVDAYGLGQSLDLAACAIHQTAENEFETLCAAAPGWKLVLEHGPILVRYAAPVKDVKTRSHRLCLNLAWPTLKGYMPLKERTDLRQYVNAQFSAHNKQMTPDAIRKAENTAGFLQFLKDRFPQFFWRDP